MRGRLLCLCLLFTLLGAALPASAQDTWEALGGVPCPDSSFTCITLTVPLDHFDATNTATLDVVFAVLPAAGERKGMFVTATGGPGSSGIALADDYSSYFDSSVLDSFDILFFDQRGLGMSGGIICPNAAFVYYSSDGEPADAARTFAQDCQAEMTDEQRAILPYLGTRQAVQDLELFRQAVGDEQLWLYGESYGTQYAQTYASMYPERIAGLILDGVVDLSLEGDEFYIEQATAFAHVLTATLEACNADGDCRDDMGGDAFAAYDTVFAELDASPVLVDYPLPDGTTDAREVRAWMIESAAAIGTYGREGRAEFLRVLAAAHRGDLVPLLRLTYSNLVVDPVTLEPITDPSWSDGGYYAVECNDYDFYAAAGERDARQAAWLADGEALAAELPYMADIFYTDLPCLYWGVQGDSERPAPFTGGDYVTFILNTNIDPATPTPQGYRIFEQIENAIMITQRGGPHVLFGRGELCPDIAVSAFLVDGTLPDAREHICPGDVIADYVPLTPLDADFPSPVTAIQALDREIVNLPEYIYWDGYEETAVGCTFGGTVTLFGDDSSETYLLDGCAFNRGLAISGTQVWVYDERITYEVTMSGVYEGSMFYDYDLFTDMVAVGGTIDGQPVIYRP
jgi:pimeloyl-ACP methyl ester carboxylesterase